MKSNFHPNRWPPLADRAQRRRPGGWAVCGWWLLILVCACGGLRAGNAGPGPGTGPGTGAGTVPDGGGRFVNFQVSVFAPYQEPGSDKKDTSESMGDLAGGVAYCRRGYYLPLVVNFYNQSSEEFDVVVQCRVNALTFNEQKAQTEQASQIDYYTEMHVGIGAPAEQTFSVLIPSDQPLENQQSLMVYIRPKGGIAGYDRKILLDDIDRPSVGHPGLKGSRLILALNHDPSTVKAFPRWEEYLKQKSKGFQGSNAEPMYENYIFTRQKKGFMVKYVPADWYALSMVNMILIDKTPVEMTWTEANRMTMMQWVRGGGVLVLTGTPDRKQWEKLGLDQMAGVRVTDEAALPVTNLAVLSKAFPGAADNDEKFVNKDRPLLVGKIRQQHDDAFVVEDDTGLILYHERRVGAGAVVVIPWELDGTSSKGAVVGDNWGRRNAIFERVSGYMQNVALGPFAAVNQVEKSDDVQLDENEEVNAAYRMWSLLKPLPKGELTDEQILAESNFSDRMWERRGGLPSHWDLDQWLFRNYLKNSFEKQSPVKLPPTRVVGGFLLLYLFLVSPLTWLVMRMLKKLEWAWPVSILLAFLFALFSYGYFYAGKQGAMICNEVSVVELTDGDPRGVAKSWLGLYSPSRGSYKIEFPDVAHAADAPIPLGIDRAVGSLMLYDRNLNLNLARDEGRGVNVTWNNLQPVMHEVYINDRSSQFFTTTSLVDFGAAQGAGIAYTVKRVAASSRSYVVTVTNPTGFDILAPSLWVNGARYALVPTRDHTVEHRQTVIPAGAKSYELTTEPDDLAAMGRGHRNDLPIHLRQQVPDAWMVSEFLHDRTVYLNSMATLEQGKWQRGNDLDALLMGWVNMPAVYIAVDGTMLNQPTEYTGVAMLVVRKPGWQNAELKEPYLVGPGDGWSFTDNGLDPMAENQNEEEVVPLNRRNFEKMPSTQVKRYGGLVNFWYQRNEPYRPGTKRLTFKAPIACAMPPDSDARTLLVNGVEFKSVNNLSPTQFTIPRESCRVRIERPGQTPQDATKPLNLAGQSRAQLFIVFEVPREKLEKFAPGEKCEFQVELQIFHSYAGDDGLLLTVGKFTVEEH